MEQVRGQPRNTANRRAEASKHATVRMEEVRVQPRNHGEPPCRNEQACDRKNRLERVGDGVPEVEEERRQEEERE